MTFDAGSTTTIDVPLLLVGGEHVFGPVLPALAENLRALHGWTDVQLEVLEDGRHYRAEERPDDIAELVERHAAVLGEGDFTDPSAGGRERGGPPGTKLPTGRPLIQTP